MKKQFAIINWTDAAMYRNESFREDEIEQLGLIDGVAIGIIVKENKESITLALDWFYREGSYRHLSTYPKSGIHKITRKDIKSIRKSKL